jgi:hypothetical protein
LDGPVPSAVLSNLSAIDGDIMIIESPVDLVFVICFIVPRFCGGHDVFLKLEGSMLQVDKIKTALGLLEDLKTRAAIQARR